MRPLLRTRCLIALAALSLCALPVAARGRQLEFRHVVLELPGPPAKIVSTDLDDDGRRDFVVVMAYTEIEETGEDRVENLVQVTQVIPTVFERRELRAYLATSNGGYVAAGPPLDLPFSVLHLEAGPPEMGVVALTDRGLSRLHFKPTLRLDPIIEDPPVLAGTGTFFATLNLIHDFDGDGREDLMLPGTDGLRIYLSDDSGLSRHPAGFVPVPLTQQREGHFVTTRYPLPEIHQLNGDGLPDLIFPEGDFGDAAPLRVWLGTGGGRFRPLRDATLDSNEEWTEPRSAAPGSAEEAWPDGLIALRDLDGDGRAEAVTREERPRGDSWRKELKDAKRPIQQLRFHRLTDDLEVVADPYAETEIIGHTIDEDVDDDQLPFQVEQFQDLDGDGREDLVTLTLRFSMFQALKILATKKIGIGIDFHVYAQGEDGRFRQVPDLDLSEKLKFDLNNLRMGKLAWFAGDFDGDGRHDFVHLGRGRKITVHTGREGCRYPAAPDLSIDLGAPPDSLDLVRIADFDGDGRSDLSVTRPQEQTDPDTDAPVRLDLYFSGGTP
jgi:hypothetical protein